MPDLQTWIGNNAGFAARFDQGDLPMAPRMSAIVVTCLDARMDPYQFLGLRMGDAFVIRCLGGRVTDGVLEQIALLQALVAGMGADPLDVIVIHHTDCGVRRFGDSEARQSLSQASGATEETIRALAAENPRASVADDLARLAAAPNLPQGMETAGYVYDVTTGRLEEVTSPDGAD